MLATLTAINETIAKAYSQNTVTNAINDINKEYDANEALMADAEQESEERVDSAPIVKLVNTMVENAFRINASDIHIEPFKDRTRIRFRIDGDLQEKMAIKPSVHNSLVTRLKILGGMNIAEKRIPCGRSTVVDGVNLELRYLPFRPYTAKKSYPSAFHSR